MFEFLSLLLVLDNQRQKISRATELEFIVGRIPLDLNSLGLWLAGLDEEVLDLLDLLRHIGWFLIGLCLNMGDKYEVYCNMVLCNDESQQRANESGDCNRKRERVGQLRAACVFRRVSVRMRANLNSNGAREHFSASEQILGRHILQLTIAGAQQFWPLNGAHLTRS